MVHIHGTEIRFRLLKINFFLHSLALFFVSFSLKMNAKYANVNVIYRSKQRNGNYVNCIRYFEITPLHDAHTHTYTDTYIIKRIAKMENSQWRSTKTLSSFSHDDLFDVNNFTIHNHRICGSGSLALFIFNTTYMPCVLGIIISTHCSMCNHSILSHCFSI